MPLFHRPQPSRPRDQKSAPDGSEPAEFWSLGLPGASLPLFQRPGRTGGRAGAQPGRPRDQKSAPDGPEPAEFWSLGLPGASLPLFRRSPSVTFGPKTKNLPSQAPGHLVQIFGPWACLAGAGGKAAKRPPGAPGTKIPQAPGHLVQIFGSWACLAGAGGKAAKRPPGAPGTKIPQAPGHLVQIFGSWACPA